MTTLAEIFYDDSLETRGKLKKIYNLSQSGVLCESEQKIVNQKNFEEVFKNFPKNGSIVDLFKELAIKYTITELWGFGMYYIKKILKNEEDYVNEDENLTKLEFISYFKDKGLIDDKDLKNKDYKKTLNLLETVSLRDSTSKVSISKGNSVRDIQQEIKSERGRQKNKKENKDINLDISKLDQIIDEFYSVKLLGEGSFGKAYKAYDSINKKYVVVKEQQKGSMSQREIDNMSLLKDTCNNYYACFIDSRVTNDHVYIVMEYLDGYIPLEDYFLDLHDELIGGSKKAMADFKTITSNLCKGLRDMHQQGLAHNDIKPANVMVNPSNNRIKYIDFGTGCIEEACKKIPGATMLYIDPLLTKDSKKVLYDGDSYLSRAQQGDLWSLGCMIYEMLTGKTPFDLYYITRMSEMGVDVKYLMKNDVKQYNMYYKKYNDQIFKEYLNRYTYSIDANRKVIDAQLDEYGCENIDLYNLLSKGERDYYC